MQQQQQCSSQQQQSSSQQQLLQQSLLSQQPQSSNHYLDFRGHHEKMVAGSGVIMDGLSCNSFRGNEQVLLCFVEYYFILRPFVKSSTLHNFVNHKL
jgi:hypothetical protein